MTKVLTIKELESRFTSAQQSLSEIKSRIESGTETANDYEQGLLLHNAVGFYKKQLSTAYIKILIDVFPCFKGNALYEDTIISLIGQLGLEILRETGTIESCGYTANGKLYTY